MTTIRLKIAALVYGLLAVVAFVWGGLAGNPNIFRHSDPLFPEFSFTLLGFVFWGIFGIAFGLVIVRITQASVYRFKWARGLHLEFRGLFGPLRNMDIFAFSAFSSIAEEMFFRGAMQSSFGIVASSLVFGVLHIAPSRKFISWPFQAIVMGFAFGGLYWISGNLVVPMLAHMTINYQNLHFINSYDPSLQLPRSFTKGFSE